MTRAPVAEDILVLDHAARDDEVRGLIGTSIDVDDETARVDIVISVSPIN